MRREEDDDPAKAPDEARSEEMTRSLTTGFGRSEAATLPPRCAFCVSLRSTDILFLPLDFILYENKLSFRCFPGHVRKSRLSPKIYWKL